MNKKQNTGIYLRVSTEKQVEKGYSLDAQKENLTNFAKCEGFNIFNYYIDGGFSGKNIEDRPGIKNLINDIKNKKIDIVLLYKFDRLTRDSKDTEMFIELIKKYDVMVYTISGGIVDVSTPSGRFNTRILGAAAQFERETIIDRIVDGLIKKVKEGYSLCSATPSYGYNREKNQKIQTINKKEAKVVRLIFKMYLENKTIKEICNELNKLKIPTKKAGKYITKDNIKYKINGFWNNKMIRNILSNVNYIGKVRYGINKEQISIDKTINYENRNKGFVTKGLHKPIIKIKDFKKVQEKLEKERKINKTKIPKEDVYFCGKLYCSECGKRLTTSRTKKINKNKEVNIYNSYRCINREKKLCNTSGISHQNVEKKFIEYIDKVITLKNIDKYVIKKFNKTNNISKLISLKQIQENKEKQIQNLFIENKIDDNKFIELEKAIKEKIFKINKEIINNKDTSKIIISNKIGNHWAYLTNEEKRKFITLFIEKIKISNINKKIIIKEISFYSK